MTDREPSMEEILSSIKRIIAEDNRRERVSRSDAAGDAGESVLELTEGDSVGAEAPGNDEELLEASKAESLGASLSALATLAEPGKSPQIVRSGETSIEQLVRDMLRPLLKDWLNEHLPPMVESMVRKEIERITRKG